MAGKEQKGTVKAVETKTETPAIVAAPKVEAPQAAPVVEAVVVAQTKKMAYQATLFDVPMFLDRVLAEKTLTRTDRKTGQLIECGVAIQPNKKSVIADALDLKGATNKAELEAAILKSTDAGMAKAKGIIASLGGDWTLNKLELKTLANGRRQILLKSQEVTRPKSITAEKVAEYLGVSVEEVDKMRKRQEAAIAAQGAEIEATVTVVS